MGSAHDWRIPQDAVDFFGHIQKKIGNEERRPLVRQAADIMGPGIGPYATTILDWSSEEAAFNGFFYSPQESANSPDTESFFYGQTIARIEGQGIQRAWRYQEDRLIPREFVRHFTSAIPGVRVYTDWATTTPQAGFVSLDFGGASFVTEFVDFEWPFAEAPIVTASYGSNFTSPRPIAYAYNISPTGCTVGLMTADGATHAGTGRRVNWHAIPAG